MKTEIVFSGKYNHINKILEINNLSDAKYYIFIVVTSDMCKCDCSRGDLINVVHSYTALIDIQIKAINAYAKGYEFAEFMDDASGEFYYLANNIDKNTSKLYTGKYVFHIQDDIDITISN